MTTNSNRVRLLSMLKLCDIAVVATALVWAVAIASPGTDNWVTILEMRVKLRNVLFVIGYLGFCHFVLRYYGLYRSYRLSPTAREWRDLTKSTLLCVVPIWLSAAPFRFEYLTPTFLAVFPTLMVAMLGVERRAFRVLARSMRRHGRNLRNAVVVTHGSGGFDMASRLARRGDLGYQILSVIGVEDEETVIGRERAVVERVSALLEAHAVDEVFCVLPLDTAQPLLRAIVALCEERGIIVRIVARMADLILARAQLDELDGQPVLTVFSGPQESPWLLVKRLIDVAAAGSALSLFAPVMAWIALLVKLDSRGPVFFVQERVGLNGRRFRFFKFRTMVVDAEARQAELETLNEARGPVFKMRDDPRISRVGKWLRRFSFDELPQLLNVLKGDMSLVGPRPLPLRDIERMDVRAHKRRLSVKPGMVCLWQVGARVPEFDEWIKTDMEYIDNWSLGLDMKILLKTIPAVISGRGAY